MEGENLQLGLVTGGAAVDQEERHLALEGVGPVPGLQTGAGP